MTNPNDYVKRIRKELKIIDATEDSIGIIKRKIILFKKTMNTKASPEARQYVANYIKTKILPKLNDWIKDLEANE